ncbi:MAG: molybdenum cofactor guanylyltransferase [Clostridiales Family XIII bacterium]|jgi:molybdopterin-guanine dinucleotide biosynthesis protein A|nr:molybdenum cofactor guanylyltransferase [Clostridiales Family XIII bacterium]
MTGRPAQADLNAYTAAILAGGKSTRMGRDKLTLDFGGAGMLASCAARFSARFGRVVLSVARAGDYPDIGLEHIADIHPGIGPIAGLHAVLAALAAEAGAEAPTPAPKGVFLCAADMPYASPQAAERICLLGEGYDACVPEDPEGRPEPLFAWYGLSLLPRAEEAIAKGRYKMAGLLKEAHVRIAAPTDLKGLWDAKSLTNINDPETYEREKNMLQ